MTRITTTDLLQFSINDENGDWLTANRTPDGVFFDRAGLVYLQHADREALIDWLRATPPEPPAPTRSTVGRPKRQGTHGRERV